MSRKSAWEEFEKTGKIESYLKYKAESRAFERLKNQILKNNKDNKNNNNLPRMS